MNEMMKSNGFKIAALVAAFILVALLGFAGGMAVGSKKALFSCRWGENYARNFMPHNSFPGGPNLSGPGPMMRDFEGRNFRNAHGLFGSIISISNDKLVIKDRDGKENTVAVTDRTIIKNRSNDVKREDLKADQMVVVMGRPSDDGTVSADLIRVFDKLPFGTSSDNQSDQNNNQ